MLPRDRWLRVAPLWGSPVLKAHLYGMPHAHAAQSTSQTQNPGVIRTTVCKVSQDFSIINYISMLGNWQLLGIRRVSLNSWGAYLLRNSLSHMTFEKGLNLAKVEKTAR